MIVKKILVGAMVTLGVLGVVAQPVSATSDLDDNICDDLAAQLSTATGADRDRLQSLADVAGCNTTTRGDQVANSLIEVVIGLVGVLAVGVMIYGGVMFVISTGDASKITKARNIMIYGVVGLVVTILAYAIVKFVSGAIGR